jgi:LPS export ABC transporter protein LptC
VGGLFSCQKNEIEKIRAISDTGMVPDVSISDPEIVFTDSGRKEIEIIAPQLKQFKLEKDPYTEFPKGLNVFFYDVKGDIKSKISANYAIYYEDDKLWEARHNVVAVNEKGEVLNTEQMFWDQEKRIIFSDKFTKINSGDEIFTGKNGFTAEQDFSKWRLKGSSGTVQIEENE